MGCGSSVQGKYAVAASNAAYSVEKCTEIPGAPVSPVTKPAEANLLAESGSSWAEKVKVAEPNCRKEPLNGYAKIPGGAAQQEDEELKEVSFSHSESLEAAAHAAVAEMAVGVGATEGGPVPPVDVDNNKPSSAAHAAPNAAPAGGSYRKRGPDSAPVRSSATVTVSRASPSGASEAKEIQNSGSTPLGMPKLPKPGEAEDDAATIKPAKPIRPGDSQSAVARMVNDYWKQEEEDERRRTGSGEKPNSNPTRLEVTGEVEDLTQTPSTTDTGSPTSSLA